MTQTSPALQVFVDHNRSTSALHEIEQVCGTISANTGIALSLSPAQQPPTNGLHWGDNGLQWLCEGESLIIDWLSEQQTYRRQHGGGNKEALAKAIGLKGGKKPRVWDLTPGLGRDATLLANLGCSIRLTERNAVLATLLEHARLNALTSDADWRQAITIEHLDSRIALHEAGQQYSATGEAAPWDVLYLDPMYPARKKKALVKKELRMIKSLVGSDPDSDQLLLEALALGVAKVVVKRPTSAEPLAGKTPNHCIRYPNTRYDVYLRKL